VFVAAALLLDFLLWLFVLIGWESVTIPISFSKTHQAQFTFPYSHGLLASILWSGLVGLVAYAVCSEDRSARRRIAALLGIAVFSHWILDVLVHRPELPLTGARSPVVGLALWDNLPVSLTVESGILLFGLALFVRHSSTTRGRTVAIAILSLAILVFTLVGMTIAPPPPSAATMAGSSVVTVAVVCALVYWLGTKAAASVP
jgi:hypothetical protein